MNAPPLVAAGDGLPRHADIVVVGGGIIGISTALHLAQRGLSTVVCEKGELGGEQSSRNWGWCRTVGRDVNELPLALESLRWWRQHSAETGFRQTGVTYLCDEESEIEQHAAWLASAGDHLDGARIIGTGEANALFPGAKRHWQGGLYAPNDGCAEPAMAVAALAKAARDGGVQFFPTCVARGVETSAGKISAVITERGAIPCSAVVVAGGAWSRLFCGNLGIDLPQLRVIGSVLRTSPVDDGPLPAATTSKFSVRRHLDGGYSVSRLGSTVADIVPDSFRLLPDFFSSWRANAESLNLRLGRQFLTEWTTPRRWSCDAETPFERTRTLDPVPVAAYLQAAFDDLRQVFPAFAGATITRRWGGTIDVTPDAIPVMSDVPQRPGLWMATGFSGHGFGIAPAAGRLMAALVSGEASKAESEAFDYRRFRRSS